VRSVLANPNNDTTSALTARTRLEKKLKGNGRIKKDREIVLLTPITNEPIPE
jgi:hypothetical protein